MKITAPGKAGVMAFAAAGCLAAGVPARGQRVVIEGCEPATLPAGQSVEMELGGRGLERATLWTSFPAQVERIEEKVPRFRISTDFIGPGAIRAHSEEGVSNLLFVTLDTAERRVMPCEKRTRREDAQVIELPAIIEGETTQFAAHFYRFVARKDQELVVQAAARGPEFDGVITIRQADDGKRLAQADDSEIHGTDPWLKFVAPADGGYLIELIDSQYRGAQAFRLEVGQGERSSLPEKSEGVIIHKEGEEEPRRLPVDAKVQGALEGADDVDAFSFNVPERSFLTIVPRARALNSPVTPRLKITQADGQVLAETPADAFDERALRLWIDRGENYLLTVSDAFGRSGAECAYRVELDGNTIPYELTVPGQKDKKHPLPDKFLAVPGGVFEVPVRCRRSEFESAVALTVHSDLSCTVENGLLGEKQNEINLRVRLPGDAAAGTLASVRVAGSAGLAERTYEQSLQTRGVLQERDPGASIPESVDGVLAVRVIERPLTVEVSPPAEVSKGTTTTVPVKLVWLDEGRKVNTTLRLVGLPGGVQTAEKKLNDKDTTTGLELKVENPEAMDLKDLRVEVSLDYHQQPLLVESEVFTIRVAEKDEKND